LLQQRVQLQAVDHSRLCYRLPGSGSTTQAVHPMTHENLCRLRILPQRFGNGHFFGNLPSFFVMTQLDHSFVHPYFILSLFSGNVKKIMRLRLHADFSRRSS
jgi:hypothetical protein